MKNFDGLFPKIWPLRRWGGRVGLYSLVTLSQRCGYLQHISIMRSGPDLSNNMCVDIFLYSGPTYEKVLAFSHVFALSDLRQANENTLLRLPPPPPLQK